MVKVGLIVNKDKDQGYVVTKDIVNWLLNKNLLVYVDYDLGIKCKNINCVNKEYIYQNSDFVIILGGDGTILGAAREIVSYDTPILGVNLGNLGFITEVEQKEVFVALEKIIKGEYKIENRLMIKAEVYRDNKLKKTLYALNDFCITRGYLSRMVKLNTFVGHHFVDAYNADGLLVSTPTGSTAYSLSAGGPIVNPTLNLMLITPICPHSLKSRTVVVSDQDTIYIEVDETNPDKIYIAADGQEGYELIKGDKIKIQKLEKNLNLIKISQRSFYDVLRDKLRDR